MKYHFPNHGLYKVADANYKIFPSKRSQYEVLRAILGEEILSVFFFFYNYFLRVLKKEVLSYRLSLVTIGIGR